jgi:DNA-binding CsgD family transcriptional regulator
MYVSLSRNLLQTMNGCVIFDSRGRIIWLTQPAVGSKEEYLGVRAWDHAAAPGDIQQAQLSWMQAMAFRQPIAFTFNTQKDGVSGSWHHVFQRIDESPIVVTEWRPAIMNPLGNRELEVALHFAADWKTGEIAEKLRLTANTVETMRRRIAHKLSVRGVAGITRWLIKAGFITP